MIKKTILFISQRAVVIYALIFILGHFGLNQEAFQIAKLRTLNRLMPGFEDFIGHHDGRLSVDKVDWPSYIHYYKKVTEYIPELAEGYLFLGYCYYQMGDIEKAISAYKKSIALNPQFFWSYYDLGIIYLKTDQLTSAQDMLKKALTVSPEATVFVMVKAKIYQPFVAYVHDFQKKMLVDLKVGYEDAKKWLVLTKIYQENPQADKTVLQEELNKSSLNLY